MVLFNEKRPSSLQLNGLVQLWFLICIVKNYFPKIATLRTMLSSLLKALILQTEKKVLILHSQFYQHIFQIVILTVE